MSATPRLSTTHTHRVIRKTGFIQKLDDMTACGEIIQHETNVIIGTKGYWQIAGTGITKDGQPSRAMLLNREDIWGRLTIGFAPAESLVKPESNEAPTCPSCLKAIASAPGQIWGQQYQMVGRRLRASIFHGCDSATQQVNREWRTHERAGVAPSNDRRTKTFKPSPMLTSGSWKTSANRAGYSRNKPKAAKAPVA